MFSEYIDDIDLAQIEAEVEYLSFGYNDRMMDRMMSGVIQPWDFHIELDDEIVF